MHQTNWKKDLVKGSTLKRKRKAAKNKNIAEVRELVLDADEGCRIAQALNEFGFRFVRFAPLELAHKTGRGMGGRASTDTADNTLIVNRWLHRHGSKSMHSGHIKVRPLTDKGTRGPCCFEFYEKLPSEIS
jgi:hypothetical protein